MGTRLQRSTSTLHQQATQLETHKRNHSQRIQQQTRPTQTRRQRTHKPNHHLDPRPLLLSIQQTIHLPPHPIPQTTNLRLRRPLIPPNPQPARNRIRPPKHNLLLHHPQIQQPLHHKSISHPPKNKPNLQHPPHPPSSNNIRRRPRNRPPPPNPNPNLRSNK